MSTNNFDNHSNPIFKAKRCNGCNEKLTQTNKIYYLRLPENDFVFCEACAKTIKVVRIQAVLNSWEESEVDICF
jgi:uncharacterized protein with PIN domain